MGDGQIIPSRSGETAVHECAPGGDAEGDAIGKGHLPVQSRREVPLDEDVALIDGRQDRANYQGRSEGPAQQRRT